MVYAVLLLALGSGDAIQGGMVMLAFGLGTLPNMLMIGGLARRARHPLKRQALRLTAAAVIAGVGLYGMIHALHPQAHTAGGLICLVAR
jgi:sulfite exporter TauE/SafE